MSFKWLKRYMPRGIYGRAALILVLPVVLLQLVVSIAFVQRHFTDVTRQLTITVIRELALVFETIEETPEAGQVTRRLDARLGALAIDAALVPGDALPERDTRIWYDFTSTIFTPMLRETFPQIRRVLLEGNRSVTLFADTRHGPVRLELHRRRFSPTAPHQLYLIMVFFGVLVTVIAFIYLRNQLRPIKRLAQAAEAFGRGRHIPYTPGGATEVRAAGTAFLEMRHRIERHIEQRTLMLSGVSHDLRTPITRLKLGLSLLDEMDREPLERDVEDMERLVDEFLGFVQGASEGEMEPVDPKKYVPRFCSELNLSEEVQTKANEIIETTAEEGLLSGKSPTGYAAAAIYAASLLCNEKKTQREVADVAQVTEVTIRNRYQEQIEAMGIH